MSDNEKQLQKLLQIKRMESPGKAYFDGFLDEFHRYQRTDLMVQKASLWSRVCGRVEDLFFFEPARAWTLCSGAAAALVVLVAVVASQMPEAGSASSVVVQSDVVVPQVAPQAAPVGRANVKLVSASSFERDFSSPRYATGQTPLSYDSALAF